MESNLGISLNRIVCALSAEIYNDEAQNATLNANAIHIGDSVYPLISAHPHSASYSSSDSG